jgi:fluoride exporter
MRSPRFLLASNWRLLYAFRLSGCLTSPKVLEGVWADSNFPERSQNCKCARDYIVLMRRYLLVAIGGGIGSLMRFAITDWMSAMPVWTALAILIVNVSGCFAISFLHFVSDPSGDIYLGPRSRLFLLLGVCGGYTTFSGFSLVSYIAARQGAFADVLLNIGLSHVLCLFSIWVGAVVAAPFPHAFRAVLRALRS